MKGRWVISYTPARGPVPSFRLIDGPECLAVPVVPCDDEAVARVASELGRQAGIINQNEISEERRAAIIERAEALLRAAGDVS